MFEQIKLLIIIFLSTNFLSAGDSWAENCTLGDHTFWVSFLLYIILAFIRLFKRKSLKLMKYILSLFVIMIMSALFSKCIYWSNIFDSFMGIVIFIITLSISIDALSSLSKIVDKEDQP